jgi:hypothetical protein
MLDKHGRMVYNISIKKEHNPLAVVLSVLLFRNNRHFRTVGGYFFFMFFINSERATTNATASPNTIIDNTSSMLSTPFSADNFT